MRAFRCHTADRFLDIYDDVALHLSTHGHALIDAWDAEPETLKTISQHFGRVQLHVRADANGLVGISTAVTVNREWEQYRSEYIGVSSEEFLPHTDGSFVQGLARHGDRYIELCPPKLLGLQCSQNAAIGGGSVLVDGQRVYHDLAEDHPRCLEALSTKGCVAYCRDDQVALGCAVFEALDDGTIMLRFRYDAAAYVAEWAVDAFHLLQQRYFSNPRYQAEFKLTSRQVLLIDNYRMLHGRAAFSNGDSGRTRSLRRIWVARDSLPVLRNAANQHREKRALKRSEPYGVLPSSIAHAPASSLALGIRTASVAPAVPSWRQPAQLAS